MKRIIQYILIIFILITILSCNFHHSLSSQTSGSTDPVPWTQWRGSDQHLGIYNGSGSSEGELRWSFQTSDQVWASPVFYESDVLIGSDDGKLYCLDTGSGEFHWKFTTGGAVQTTPLIIGRRAYFGSSDGFFYCLELPEPGGAVSQPIEKWRFDCGGPIVSSAHSYKGSLIFGCQNGFFFKLSEEGELLWKADLDWELWASPLLDPVNGLAFIGATNGNYSCIDLVEEEVVWTIDAGEVYSSGCLMDGVIYLTGGLREQLYAINPVNGSIIWTFDTGLPTYTTPSIFQGRLYFASYEMVWCIPSTDPNNDGVLNETEIIWSSPHNDREGGSSQIVADGKVYVGSDDGGLYCFDMENGAQLWNYTTGGYVYSSPSVYNNSIYFGSCDGQVYCIGNRPIRLNVLLEPEFNEIKAQETLQIKIQVNDQNGTAVEGAELEIILSSGDFEMMGLNVENPEADGNRADETESRILTGQNGRVRLLYKPPPVTSRSTVEITVIARKEGINPGTATILIVIKPGNGQCEDDDAITGELVDNADERIPYYTLFTGFIILDLILALVIRKMKNSSDRSDEQ